MSTDEINTILVVSAHYYPIKGGTPTHTHCLCTALSDLGKDVHLITAGGDVPVTDDVLEHDSRLNYTLHRIPTRGSYKDDFYFLWSIWKKLPKYIDHFHPDIVNISTGNFVPLALRFADTGDVPIVYTVHNVPPEEHPFNHSFGIDVFTSIVRRIYLSGIGMLARMTITFGRHDFLISVSENTKKKLIQIGANPKQIHIVGNGISVPAKKERVVRPFNFDNFRIITVAGVIEHKGQLNMVYAMKKILLEIPSAKYYIVGPVRSPEYRDRIVSVSKDLGIEDFVILTGEVTHEELEEFYESCDIYVQPSHQEGFCIAILDAMVREKPVIGTDVGEIAKFVADGKGILLEQPDAEDLSNAVLRYVRDSEFRVSAAEKGRDYVEEHYSWKHVAYTTLEVYERTKISVHRGNRNNTSG